MLQRKGRLFLVLLATLFVVAAGCTDFSKFSNAPVSVYVTVVDSEGNPIPDSQVRLAGTQTIGPVLADTNGVATFAAVPRDNYLAAVAAPGGAAFGGDEFAIWGGKDFSATVIAEPAETGSVDINASPGWTEVDGDTVRMNADSNDIDGASDSFRFWYTAIPTDVTMEARVVNVENHVAWTKAGVMIRESLTPGSKQMTALLTGDNGVQSIWRTETDKGASQTYTGSDGGISYPYYVRIERKGNTITTFYSADGNDWTQHQQHNIHMGSTVYVGLALSAHSSNGSAVTGLFENVKLIPSL